MAVIDTPASMDRGGNAGEAAADGETSGDRDARIRQQVHITPEAMARVKDTFLVGEALPEDVPHDRTA